MLIYYRLLRESKAVISDVQYRSSSFSHIAHLIKAALERKLIRLKLWFKMCYLYFYNIFGLQNKVLDLLLRCQNVSHVAFRNVLYCHLTSDPKLTGKLKLSTFSCSYFFPYREHVFMFIMSYWTALRLLFVQWRTLQNVRIETNWIEATGREQLWDILQCLQYSVFAWHFIMGVQFLESWRWFYSFKYLSDDVLWVYYALFSLTIVGIVYPKNENVLALRPSKM